MEIISFPLSLTLRKEKSKMKDDIGIYVHIPFCKKKCDYCDFTSFSGKEDLFEDYTKAVIKEIEYIKINKKYNIKTVYIGGGTPSILNSFYIGKILDKLNINKDTEVTIEMNPGTVDEKKLNDYFKFGINRLSIGLQTTNDRLLKQIGRIHNYEDFLQTYRKARKIGFRNINVDLMLGLPNQSMEDLQESLNDVMSLKPEHISLYSLIIEEGTKLESQINNGTLKTIDEDLERKMYWESKRILEKSGYIHYEISNFASEGFMSCHNLDCWNQKEYLGIGVSAHSYLEDMRFSNLCSIENYIDNINNGKFVNNKIIHEKQTKEMKCKEFMLLGLRKIEGVSISEYKYKFKDNPLFIYNKKIAKLVDEELIEIDGNYIKLTQKGLDFANIVWEEFI